MSPAAAAAASVEAAVAAVAPGGSLIRPFRSVISMHKGHISTSIGAGLDNYLHLRSRPAVLFEAIF